MGLLNGKPFINLVSGGFGSRVTVETDPELKRRLGGLAYLLTGISRFAKLSANRGSFRRKASHGRDLSSLLRLVMAGKPEAVCSFARTRCSMTVCSI